jgi:dihydroorotate dehydrogenase electron transfer subunit
MDDLEGRIIENRNLTGNYYRLRVRLAGPMGPVEPGQFVMVKVPGDDLFLRRPFSIYSYSRGVLAVMYRVTGKGTDTLSSMGRGTRLSILGPLGRGFAVLGNNSRIVVAGGIGLAGVHLLVKRLRSNVTLLFGCSSAAETAILKGLEGLHPLVATLDGSSGYKGTAIDLLASVLPERQAAGEVTIYACGPEGMIKNLKQLLERAGTPCQVAVEERMACGLGLCFGCVTRTTDAEEPYKRVCKEGPVFSLWELSL